MGRMGRERTRSERHGRKGKEIQLCICEGREADSRWREREMEERGSGR